MYRPSLFSVAVIVAMIKCDLGRKGLFSWQVTAHHQGKPSRTLSRNLEAGAAAEIVEELRLLLSLLSYTIRDQLPRWLRP